MIRRTHLATRRLLLAVALLSTLTGGQTSHAAGADPREGAIRAFVTDFYRTFSTSGNPATYRALLAPGYLLIEDGRVLDADEDVAGMPKPDASNSRTDSMEFRQVTVRGTTAHAVYRLRSTIVEGGRTYQKEWMESLVLHRIGGRWRAAVLHSTTIGTR